MAEKKKTAEKKRKKMGIFPILLLLIFLSSLGACIYLLYEEVDKELSIKDMETDIQTFIKPSEQPPEVIDDMNNTDVPADSSPQPAEDVYVFDWEGMMEKSDYVVGWIQMPGIERINYPVVQHPDDNQFFLKHDWTGASQSAGAIFMNVNNSPDFSDMNTVVYGHRMKAGSMFGLLKYYAEQDFMDDNPYFYIYMPDGRKLTYEVICYSIVTDGSDAYLLHFESPKERMAYYSMMMSDKIALAKRDVELDRFDTTIMLSTCKSSKSEDYYKREVLLAKLIAIELNSQPENSSTE